MTITPVVSRTINHIGFIAGIIAFGAAVAYSIVQVLQLYGITAYPTDEILIYSTSLLIVIPFLSEILALHYVVPTEKKFWTHLAVLFATIYAVFVTANYVVQLATVIPMSMKEKLDEIRILQQTPHSLFWDFDGIGYIFMGLATAALIPVFKRHGLEKWVRVAFIGNALMTSLITIVYFYPTYSYKLLLIAFPWAITAPVSILLLAFVFKQNNHVRQQRVKKLDPVPLVVEEQEEY